MNLTFRKLALFVLVALLACSWVVPVEARPGEGAAAEAPNNVAAPSADDLLRTLKASKGEMERDIASLRGRAQDDSRQLARMRKSAEDLELEISLVRAMLALHEPGMEAVQAFSNHFTLRRGELSVRAGETSTALDLLKERLEKSEASFKQLEKEVERLKASRLAEVWNDSLDESFDSYQRLAHSHVRALGRLREILQSEKELIDRQIGLVDGIAPQLARLREVWTAELLSRRADLTLGEQIAQSWESLISLPERGVHWAMNTLKAGTIQKFITERPGFLVGLVCILGLLLWGGPRLRARSSHWFMRQESEAESVGIKVFLRFSRHLVSLILPILLALWVFVALRALHWTETSQGRIILDSMATIIVLGLFLRMNRSLFGSRREPPLLDVDRDTATFYRRNLRFLLGYTAMGILGLAVLQRLAFPATVLQLIRYVLELGWIIAVIRLLQPGRLEQLTERLSPPEWNWWPRLRKMGVVRGMLTVLIVLNVLLYLVGFQGLASFVVRAMTVSLVLVFLWTLLSLAGSQLIHTLLHGEHGLLGRRLPDRSDLLGRLCTQLQRLLRLGLAAALALGVLAAWGIEPAKLLEALEWLKWEIPLGSFQLTPLKLILATLVVYLGIGLSRLLGQILGARVFPRAGWDIGVQYTISTILHYLMLLFVGLLALDVLGFPLANLALVMGAVGVGVGLGLQNMVSNFFSGLVLLIERPIKVGDLLVIDGQWGEVKEIRIRATVFQTVEKSIFIIPNSELTSGKILNWTHYGRGATRITLQVGVSYDSDVRRVTQVLRDICRANPRVMADPAPNISFSAYGESSLDFNVMVHVRAPEDRIPATHELNTAIFDAFKENGIEIPFPQRDLYIKNWPRRLTEDGSS
jgi:small-conductance mechanosensitive channel